jgi:hypothetical protein
VGAVVVSFYASAPVSFAEWMGLVQAAATLGALYVAWRAVHETRIARNEYRSEREGAAA